MSRKKILIIFFIVALLALGAFLYYKNGTRSDRNNTISEVIPPEEDTRVFLEPQNGLNNPGNVSLIPQQSRVSVELSMAGLHTDPYIAAVYEGTCDSLESKKYSLSNIVGGQSKTSLSVSLETLQKELPLSIVVTKNTNLNSILSCGEISTKSTSTQ